MWLLRILKIAAVLTPFIPSRIGYLVCRILGLAYWLVNRRTRRNVASNLLMVAPDSGLFRRNILSARVSITVVTNYYDLLRMRSVDRTTILDLVELTGLENVERALEQGKGAIILSAHVGNFSVMARLPSALGYDAAIVAERIQPAELFNYMARLRSAMGIRVIPPDSSMLRNVTSLLKRNGILLLAGDRDVSGLGHRVRFFGRETTLPAGPIMLAMRTGAPVLPAVTLRNREHRSTVWIGPPICLTQTGDRERDLECNMITAVQQLERMISIDPGQWAVLQRVWPPTSHFGRSEGIGSADTPDATGLESEALPGREDDSAVRRGR